MLNKPFVKHIQKDVDKRLLVLVIILLVLFTASSVYYEVTYNSILSKYNKNRQLVEEITANGVTEDLNKTSSLKENILQYKEYLDKRYDEVNTFNGKLKEELASLQGELAIIKSQEEYQKAKDLGPSSQFRLYQAKVEEANNLKKVLKELCAKLSSLNISESGCSNSVSGRVS